MFKLFVNRKERAKDPEKSSGQRDPFGVRVRRGFLYAFKTLLLLLCIVISIWFGYRLHFFLFESPYFRLTKVEVPGLSDELAEELLDFARLDDLEHRQYNLLRMSTGKLEKQLKAMPKLRFVEIYKDYPDTLRILSHPRKAVVLLAGNGLYLADSEGMIMERLTPEKRKEVVFPVITGISDDRIRTGEMIRKESFFKALDIQAALNKHCDRLYRLLSELHLHPHGGITAIFVGGTEVRFGRKNPLARLPELDAFMRSGLAVPRYKLEGLRYIDLRFKEQIVYALQEENEAVTK